MEWINHGERPVYESPWISVGLADVEVPGGNRFDHHVMHAGTAVGTFVLNELDEVLLLWRHRFITDTWGWELPAGRVDAGESLEAAARRETLEETGWNPTDLTELVSFFPTNGISDQKFHIFTANGATHVGPPTDPSEATRIEWIGVDLLRSEIAAGRMPDGLSLAGCSYAFAFDPRLRQ